MTVLQDIFEGLTSLLPSGVAAPGGAENWTVDATGTRYVFQLRPGLEWSNGDPLTADEFVFGIRRSLISATASKSAELLSVIENAPSVRNGLMPPSKLGVQALTETQVAISLEHPAPYILEVLASPIASPIHRGLAASSTSLTNGPYRLSAHKFGAQIELERNPNYWNKGRVFFSHVKYIPFFDQNSEIRMYMGGELDLTSTIPSNLLPKIATTMRDQVRTAPILGTAYIAFNLSNGPLMRNKQLRQALSMAIDRDLISQRLTATSGPAYSFVPGSLKGYRPSRYEWATWPADRRHKFARTLYESAGFSQKSPLSLTFYFNENEGVRSLVLAVADGWRQVLGVRTIFKTDELRVFLDRRKYHDQWDAIRLGWIADFADASNFLTLFIKGNPQNDPAYYNQAFEVLLRNAKYETNGIAREASLSRAEAIFLDDYAIAPIYFYLGRHLVKPGIGGAAFSPMDQLPTKFLYRQQELTHR